MCGSHIYIPGTNQRAYLSICSYFTTSLRMRIFTIKVSAFHHQCKRIDIYKYLLRFHKIKFLQKYIYIYIYIYIVYFGRKSLFIEVLLITSYLSFL